MSTWTEIDENGNPINWEPCDVPDPETGYDPYEPNGSCSIPDHGILTGLEDDDHTQYHNDERGDLRYSQIGHNHTGVYEPADSNIQLHLVDNTIHFTQSAIRIVESQITNLDKYSQSETDTLLSGKSDTDHTHTDLAPLSHNHDSRYYTETEMNGFLANKSNTDHSHDAVYSQIGHNHNSDYYLQSQVNGLLAQKSDTDHTHPSYLTDAPIDTYEYVRKDGSWQKISAGTAIQPGDNISLLTNDAGYITSFTETDPVYSSSPASGITNTNITNWNTAYGWGDHSTAGYEPAITKNTAFNKDFGSVAGTVCEGDDTRLSDARTPTAHTHTESDITDLDKYTKSEVDGFVAVKPATIDKVSDALIYRGMAPSGTATSAAKWLIEKYTKTGLEWTITYPDGVADYTKVWDNRTGYTYS